MLGQSNVIKFVLFGVAIFGIGVIVLNIISYNRRQSDYKFSDKKTAVRQLHSVNKSFTQFTPDFQSDTKPSKFNNAINIPKVSIQTYKISMNDGENKILVREAGTGGFNILLLHDQSSSSTIWEKIGTLQYLTSWGYRAFAIDIPGYGDKSSPVTNDKTAVQWLTRLFRILHLSNLVIISPSMSGRLTLPYILQLKSKQKLVKGFVAIAPEGAKNFDSDRYTQFKIPTLIVYGENDNKFLSSLKILQQIPTSEILLIKNASHACYVDKPNDFHNGLRQFLYSIYRPIFIKDSRKRLKPKNNKSPSTNRTKSINKQNKKLYEQRSFQ